ncbi:MAG: dockerin type I domain-containing protein [Deltaproteobacteria bacterium]
MRSARPSWLVVLTLAACSDSTPETQTSGASLVATSCDDTPAFNPLGSAASPEALVSSADGSVVAFTLPDGAGGLDVFVRDLAAETQVTLGTAVDPSYLDISGDGEIVVFQAAPYPNVERALIFRRDGTELAELTMGKPRLSADGGRVAVENYNGDIYSVAVPTQPAGFVYWLDPENLSGELLHISDDGRYLAYRANINASIERVDRTTGDSVTAIPTGPDPVAFSADGTTFVFRPFGNGFAAYDFVTGVATTLSTSGWGDLAISDDGAYAISDTDQQLDPLLHVDFAYYYAFNLVTQEAELIDIDRFAVGRITMSGDGRFLVYATNESLVPADTSPGYDLYAQSNPTQCAASATYLAQYAAPGCDELAASCDTGTLVESRGNIGPELNTPNTLFGTCLDGNGAGTHANESIERIVVRSPNGANIAPYTTLQIDVTTKAYGNGTSDFLDVYYTDDIGSLQWTHVGTLQGIVGGEHTYSMEHFIRTGDQLHAFRTQWRYMGGLTPPGPCSQGYYTDHDDLIFSVERATSWQNPHLQHDVNDDGTVSPLDALVVINKLGAGGPSLLPPIYNNVGPPPYYDVNDDGHVTSSDALAVINYLAQQQ